MKAHHLPVALAVVALAFAPAAAAQSVQFDLGLGYQLLDESGNEDVFRTHTGEKEGWLLDTLGVTAIGGEDALFDRLRIDAAGIGASPDARVRVRIDRGGSYAFSLSYMHADVFTALPGFANPLLAAGVIPGQHTLDRRRDNFDLDLELRPGKAFTPMLGYSRYRCAGGGRSTLFFGQDEFVLDTDLEETVDEYRVGFGVAAGGWRATLLQGWRSTNSSYDYALAEAPSVGNNARPVLGRDVFAATLAGHSRTTGIAPFTNVHLSSPAGSRFRLVASYARLVGGEADTDDTLSATGSFVSFALQRFFSGAGESISSSAKLTAWRGEARAEIELAEWLDLIASYTSSQRELDGGALIAASYLGSVNFSGADARNVTTVLTADTAWEREDKLLEGKLVARPAWWLRLWAAAGQADQEVAIVPAAAEIVVPGGQGGLYERSIDRLSAGAGLDFEVVELSADWLSDEADHAVVRTDYLDRERLRVRATVKIGSLLRLIGSGEWIDLANPTPGIDYDAEIEHYAAAIEVVPLKALTIRASYDSYTSDSSLLIRVPHDFTTSSSIYAEDGEGIEGGLALDLGRFAVDAGMSTLSNKGDLAFDLDRTWARFDVDITESVGIYGQWESREYSETLLPIANYTSDRYGLFLRWTK